MTPEELEVYTDKRIDARMEAIAEVAARKAIQLVYAELGEGILRKAAWIAAVGILALLSWMAGKGMKLPSL